MRFRIGRGARAACGAALAAGIAIAAGSPARASAPASLVPSVTDAAIGQAVTFAYAGPAAGQAPLVLDFGDGTRAMLPGSQGTAVHAYGALGAYTALLCQVSCDVPGGVVAAAGITIETAAPRVPFGSILATSVLGGPFLAGATAHITFAFRIAEPGFFFEQTPEVALQAVVDLESEHGDLIRRSDALELPNIYAAAGIAFQQSIDYVIPGDAKGAYRLRVFLRTDGGATVAVGTPVDIVVFGAPDPAPVVSQTFHASGSIITGPTTSTAFGQSSTTTSFRSDMTTALSWPTQTLSLTGLYDPVSRRSDPVATLASASPGPAIPPDAVSTPAVQRPSGGAPSFADTLGRTTVALSQLLGGGDTLRGLDLHYAYADGWTYHAGVGYTQLGSDVTTPRRGGAFDVTRSWGGTETPDTLQLGYFGQSDDASKFVPNGSLGPTAGGAVVLELHERIAKNVAGVFAGGRSASHLETGPPASSSDAATKAGLQYALGSVAVNADYHDYGQAFAVGGGPGAMSDLAGFDASASAAISPASNLSLGWVRDDKRSTFSRHTDETATFSTQPPNGVGLQVTATHDRMVVVSSAVTSDTLAYAVTRSWPFGGSVSLSGTATGSLDALQANSASTVRTTSLTYSLQRGSHVIGGGLSANVFAGALPNATVMETASYGFGFGGREGAPPAYELQLSAMGGNTSGLTSSLGRDSMYTAVLSRHFSQQAALGLRVESGKFVSPYGFGDTKTSSVRLQLDLNV